MLGRRCRYVRVLPCRLPTVSSVDRSWPRPPPRGRPDRQKSSARSLSVARIDSGGEYRRPVGDSGATGTPVAGSEVGRTYRPPPRCAAWDGYTVHAGTAVGGRDAIGEGWGFRAPVLTTLIGRADQGHPLHSSGELSVRLLIVALAITPLRLLVPAHRWPRWLLARRRAIGVASLGCGALHLAFYACPQRSRAQPTLRRARSSGRCLALLTDERRSPCGSQCGSHRAGHLGGASRRVDIGCNGWVRRGRSPP